MSKSFCHLMLCKVTRNFVPDRGGDKEAKLCSFRVLTQHTKNRIFYLCIFFKVSHTNDQQVTQIVTQNLGRQNAVVWQKASKIVFLLL